MSEEELKILNEEKNFKFGDILIWVKLGKAMWLLYALVIGMFAVGGYIIHQNNQYSKSALERFEKRIERLERPFFTSAKTNFLPKR